MRKNFLHLLLLVILFSSCSKATPTPSGTDAPPATRSSSLPSATLSASLQVSDLTPAVADLASRLQSLGLEEFFEVSWRELMLRNPELVLEVGLTEVYGVKEAKLTDISDAYVRETYQMMAVILDLLRQYQRAALTQEQQLSYDIYVWYLEDQLRGQEFMYNDYPATFFPSTAVHELLIQFFTDIHPVASLQDAHDYVTRLGLVDTKIDQLLEGLKLREQAGIIPPRFAIQWAVYGSLGNLVETPAKSTPFYTAFETKVNALEEVSAKEKQALLEDAEAAVEDTVLPAYKKLAQYLAHLEPLASSKDGVWQFENGEAYYAYLLQHYTTTNLSPEQIHQLGLDELERIHAEMRAIFDELGYPQGESLTQSFDRASEDGGLISGSQVLKTYEELIQQADQNLDAAFDMRPRAKVVVIGDQYGGFYIPGSVDGSRPGAFYAAAGGAGEDYFAMPTLAYHEAIPGHHFQISLAQEMDLPSFRRGASFMAYTEGWALYAERLAWELGWYEDDPYGNLGRLQAAAFRAARLVVDTGLHTKSWNFDQAQEFFTQNTGFEIGDSVNPQHQIARYVVWPGQSTAYYIGFLKMVELRQKAMQVLGDQFDLKAFHRLILSNGSVPLTVLERLVDDYLLAEQARIQGGLSLDEARTLASLEKVSDYPLYTMHYSGDYLQRQATAIGDTSWFTPATPNWACSLFAALGDPGGHLYGRNFDWEYSPAMLLFTNPPGGYASVSMVDIAYLVGGGQVQNLADLPLAERRGLLEAPGWPFDGMNEQGLAIGMAAVPPGDVPPDPTKETLGSLQVMRQVLDHARNVDEAVAILQQYNIDFEGGPPLHYLVADRSGRAVLVEFFQGKVVLLPNASPWHQATNFLRSAAGDSPQGACWRYDRISQGLTETGGRLAAQDAMDLLAQVAQESTQWSIVYGISAGEVTVAMGGQYASLYTFSLP